MLLALDFLLQAGHRLCNVERLTLEDIAAEALITYHPSFTGRARIDQAFATHKLQPRIALEAIDSDVITTYVRLGLGVGIAAEMAVRDIVGDGALVVRPVGHLVLKGKNQALEVFEPVDDALAERYAGTADYAAAFSALHAQADDAATLFAALAARYPQDPLVELHHRRLAAGARGDLIVMDEK